MYLNMLIRKAIKELIKLIKTSSLPLVNNYIIFILSFDTAKELS